MSMVDIQYRVSQDIRCDVTCELALAYLHNDRQTASICERFLKINCQMTPSDVAHLALPDKYDPRYFFLKKGGAE
jgi:hypothetical protein